MSRGGVVPTNRPTAWVYLHPADLTIRWRRGDDVAYVFSGRQMQTYPDESPGVEPLAVITVPPRGWADLAEIRRVGQRWRRSNAA